MSEKQSHLNLTVDSGLVSEARKVLSASNQSISSVTRTLLEQIVMQQSYQDNKSVVVLNDTMYARDMMLLSAKTYAFATLELAQAWMKDHLKNEADVHYEKNGSGQINGAWTYFEGTDFTKESITIDVLPVIRSFESEADDNE